MMSDSHNHQHIDPKCSCQKMSWLERKVGKQPKCFRYIIWSIVSIGLLAILLCVAYGIAKGTFSFTGLM